MDLMSGGLGVSWILWDEGKEPPSPQSFLMMNEELVWPKHGRKGLAHCDLAKTICKFYLDEELKAMRMLMYLGNYPYSEERYISSIADSVETILKFSLSAMIGEARHFHNRVPEEHYKVPSRLEERHRLSFEYYGFLSQLLAKFSQKGYFGGLNCTSRSTIYSWAIPYNFWLPILYCCEKIFNGLWGGIHHTPDTPLGYGGEKWRKATVFAIDLARAWGAMKPKRMVIAADTLINQCHNNGMLLNKFDCGSYLIKDILSSKKIGDSLYLSYTVSREKCCSEGYCGSNVWSRFPKDGIENE